MAGGGDGVLDLELEGLGLLDEDLTRDGIFLNRSSILSRNFYSDYFSSSEQRSGAGQDIVMN